MRLLLTCRRCCRLGVMVLLMATPALADPKVVLIAPDAPLPRVVTGRSQLEQDAAADFCHYLSRVTGQKISVSKDMGDDKVIIHIGRDRFVEQHVAGVHQIRADGFVIKCVDHGGSLHLVLAGNLDRAAQWAVERFLRDHCGVRWLFPDPIYGEVVPSRTTITVDRKLSKTYEPDFVSRSNSGMYYFTPGRRLLRLGPYGNGYGGHAIQHIFSTEEFREHPDWFAYFDGKRQWWNYGNGWQICTTNPGTVRRAVAYVDEFFKRNPHAPIVSIGQNDGNGWCQCTNCTKFVNSFSPPYSFSERWFHWVNLVAREVGQKHSGKWIEAMAYSSTSEPPRFKLEPNVAVTKTFVLDSEFRQAERWKDFCKSVNLYSYMYGASFLGFRHYPHAAQQFLKWGHDELGALAHVTECGGDWTFDGPKYYYLQALQWDVNADVDRIMDEFCAASYGNASQPMRAFWDRLEEVYERRKPGPYRRDRKDWLFYQWVSWSTSSYVQPNDEFRDYTLDDVAFLDRCISESRELIEDESARFRLERLADAWKFNRSLLVSYLKFHEVSFDLSIESENDLQTALKRARNIAEFRRERALSLAKMRSYPHINPRISKPGFWSWGSAISIFSSENTLLDELCSAVSVFRKRTVGHDATVKYWQDISKNNSLYESARTQLNLLSDEAISNRLINGGFETGDLSGWNVDRGQLDVLSNHIRTGTFAVGSTVNGAAILSQQVSVSPRERYRLTAWGQYLNKPPEHAVPLEATVEFQDGQQPVFTEPIRSVMQTLDETAGWIRLRLTVTVPPRADSAIIKLKRTFNGKSMWDDVVFERIQPGPDIEHGTLTDPFDKEHVDFTKWSRVPGQGGTDIPQKDNGMLSMGGDSTHAIASLSRFNEIIKYRGSDRYRLRFRAASILSSMNNRPSIVSFSITNTRQPTTRMLWYLYFSDVNRSHPMLSCFNVQAGTSKFTNSWNLNHLEKQGDEIWCTMYFDPDEVTVFASTGDHFDESKESLVCRYRHGISDMTANGSVYLTLYNGTYRIAQLSLTRPSVALRPQ